MLCTYQKCAQLSNIFVKVLKNRPITELQIRVVNIFVLIGKIQINTAIVTQSLDRTITKLKNDSLEFKANNSFVSSQPFNLVPHFSLMNKTFSKRRLCNDGDFAKIGDKSSFVLSTYCVCFKSLNSSSRDSVPDNGTKSMYPILDTNRVIQIKDNCLHTCLSNI